MIITKAIMNISAWFTANRLFQDKGHRVELLGQNYKESLELLIIFMLLSKISSQAFYVMRFVNMPFSPEFSQ